MFSSAECYIYAWKKGMSFQLDTKTESSKGRVVFGGNDVWTQNRDIAIFQELASQPATLEASCAADAYGCIEGHTIEQADAEQAYVQAVMKRNTYLRKATEAPMAGQLERHARPSRSLEASAVRTS